MSTYMRQVTQQEFEILTKFHPGEVRYYVDIGKATKRTSGAKVQVKRKPVNSSSSGSNSASMNRGRHIQLGVEGTGKMSADSVQYRVYCAATRILAQDPTKVMLRTDLTAKLDKALPIDDKIQRIVPSITSLLKAGRLRYTGAPT